MVVVSCIFCWYYLLMFLRMGEGGAVWYSSAWDIDGIFRKGVRNWITFFFPISRFPFPTA